MAKFNTRTARARTTSPVRGEQRPTGRTYEGGPGYAREAKGELYLLAVTNMGSEKTFYESASGRDSRYAHLIRQVAVEDPAWLRGFLPWLRSEAWMRTAPAVGVVEAVRAMAEAGIPGGRSLTAAVPGRSDEPGEIMAYHYTHYGRALPKPLKRGLADACDRLYTQRCVTPETRVLTRSLVWVQAGELLAGDELVGFDEQVRSRGAGQSPKMRVSTVTGIGRALLETVRITTDRGETSVSTDHLVVVSNKTRNREWCRAEDLKAGDKLLWFGAPWETDRSYEAGYMAGFLDGEGYVTAIGKTLGYGQNLGDTLEYTKDVLKSLGFSFNTSQRAAHGNRKTLERVILTGGRYAAMRLLGTILPVRLSRDRLWVGRDLVSKGPYVAVGSGHATVLTVEPLGIQENVTIGTTTKTFIADGFLAHNSLLKYDTDARAFRFGDVIEQVRPRGRVPADLLARMMDEDGFNVPEFEARQGVLYKYAIDRRHNRNNVIDARLGMICNNINLRKLAESDPAVLLDTERLYRAGMTWENGLSLAGSRVSKAKLWEAFIPVMGVEALLKNLRNFDQAGVSDEAAAIAAAKISNAEDVRRSRQFPMRFLAAYRAAPSLRWGYPLEQGLSLSLANFPVLSGRTLVLVDTSGSMNEPFSKDGELMRWDAAAIYGIAIAQRCAEADLVSFSGRSFYHENRQAVTKEFPLAPGESLLKSLDRWRNGGYFIGRGTDTDLALAKHYAKHDRIVIVTDEQAAGDVSHMRAVVAQRPENIPLYTFNLAGYKRGHAPSGFGNCHVIGGLNDASFKMIGLLEKGRDGAYPWM